MNEMWPSPVDRQIWSQCVKQNTGRPIKSASQMSINSASLLVTNKTVKRDGNRHPQMKRRPGRRSRRRSDPPGGSSFSARKKQLQHPHRINYSTTAYLWLHAKQVAGPAATHRCLRRRPDHPPGGWGVHQLIDAADFVVHTTPQTAARRLVDGTEATSTPATLWAYRLTMRIAGPIPEQTQPAVLAFVTAVHCSCMAVSTIAASIVVIWTSSRPTSLL